MSVSIEGDDNLQDQLQAIKENKIEIARAAVRAGCAVSANACRNAAPGTIKQEIGFHVRTEGDEVVGRAGLMRFPREGDGQDGPHGIYLERGTKHIAPRLFIQQALRSSRSAALAAMKRAAKGKIQSVANKGQ